MSNPVSTAAEGNSDSDREAREEAAFNKIRQVFKAVGPIHEKQRAEGYAIHPHSALQLDRDRMPDLPVESSVDRLLFHSLDCLWGLHQLLKHEGQQHFAPYLLLRGALETAATAVWLLAPDDRTTRLERRAAIEANDASESRMAIKSAGVSDPRDTTGDRIRALPAVIQGAGLDPEKCKWSGYGKVIKEIDERPGTRYSLESAWRASSGMAHGKFWAFTAVAVESDRTFIGPREFRATFTPSYHPMAIMLDLTVATLQRVDRLYDKRRAAII
jgi:hypothetical protein